MYYTDENLTLYGGTLEDGVMRARTQDAKSATIESHVLTPLRSSFGSCGPTEEELFVVYNLCGVMSETSDLFMTVAGGVR